MTTVHSGKPFALTAIGIISMTITIAAATVAAPTQTADTNGGQFDRSKLPAALQHLPLERLSSGALLRLDQDGNLVETHAAWSARVAAIESSTERRRAAAVALDPRVGANIRLGDDPPELPSTRRAQAEPHIFRAAGNPDFLVATFQEGRFETGGGAVKCGYSVSQDGGLTWTRALIPGSYIRETDPVAAINIDGTILLNTLGGRNTGSEPFNDADLVVSRSSDGGQTFTRSLAYRPSSGSIDPDKNWMAVNTFPGTLTAGRVVLTFTNFIQTSQTGVNSPIVRVYSDDGGENWSSASYLTPTNADCQGSQPVFLRDGRLAVVYWNFGEDSNPSNDDFMEVVVSDNGGTTFGAPKFIASVNLYSHPSIRDGSFLPNATTDRTTGTLFVVYQAVHNGVPRIMFTKSPDAGTSWTTPIPISDNPTGSGVFNAAVAASPDGQTLTAAFYSNRDNPGSSTMVDMYLAQSFDGGATWQPNIRLTSVSSNAALAPLTSGGYMLGDYIGIAEPTNENVPAVPVWVDTRTGNPDPFVTRIGIAPEVTFTAWQAARLSFAQINNPELGGQSGDADGDLEDNLSEFRSGTEPNDPLSVFRTGRLLNISTRTQVRTGDNVSIGGFIITASEAKQVMIRALGPSLENAGVSGALQDPIVDLFNDSVFIARNDDWDDSQQAAIEQSGIPPTDERESAMIQTLAPGNYTAVVRGKNETSGVGLVEVYDLSGNAGSELANVSNRGFVGTDDRVMIGGFIIGAGLGTNGTGSARVLLRGIGPSLAQFGTAGPLQDPELLLVDGNGAIIASNDNWRQTQEAEIAATGAQPDDEREAALIAILPQGNYTAIVRGKDRTTGVGLVEAFNLP